MKTWDDVTKEDILYEVSPGVFASNEKLIEQLNWFEYLRHIRDMIDMGMYLDRELVDEHIEDVLESIFMTATRLLEDRPAEPDEVSNYMTTEYAIKTREALVNLTISHTPETWPAMEADIRKRVLLEDE